MDFIKKYKYQILGIAIFLILIIIAIVTVVHLLYPNTKASYYGNRLEGIEKVPVKEDTLRELVTEIKKSDKVANASATITGKIINVIIDVKKGVDLVTAKTFADKTLSFFTKEQKEFYDVELFLTCKEDEKSEVYPKVGYKHKTSVTFKWTN